MSRSDTTHPNEALAGLSSAAAATAVDRGSGSSLHGSTAWNRSWWNLTVTPAVEGHGSASNSDPLPRGDDMLLTWSVTELQALADLESAKRSGIRATGTSRRPQIRSGAPARVANRLASFCSDKIGDWSVVAGDQG